MRYFALLRLWIMRLITWDGLVPMIVWTTPSLVELLLPNNRGAIEITAVVLPIIGFFIRYHFGKRHITTNQCRSITRGIQLVVFCIGLVILLVLDAFMILTHVMPPQPKDDFIVFLVIYSVYLALMTIPMYPGLSKSPPDYFALSEKRSPEKEF